MYCKLIQGAAEGDAANGEVNAARSRRGASSAFAKGDRVFAFATNAVAGNAKQAGMANATARRGGVCSQLCCQHSNASAIVVVWGGEGEGEGGLSGDCFSPRERAARRRGRALDDREGSHFSASPPRHLA